MGILDSVTRTTPAGNKQADAKREDRKPSQIWLNIGTNVQLGDETIFVSLPSGLPLDDMKQVKVRGGEDFANLMQSKNGLLEELQKLGSKMQPGERRIIPLEVEIYRVGAEQAATGTPEGNPLLKAMFAQLGSGG